MKIEVNSRDRSTGTPEAYTYELRQVIKDVRGFKLEHVLVPNTMFRIVTGYNDTFKFQYTPSTGGSAQTTTDYIGTITGDRNYTPAELAAAVQAEIRAETSLTTQTVTYNTTTNKLEFLVDDADVLNGYMDILSSARQMSADAVTGFALTGVARLGGWMLGVAQTDPNDTTTTDNDTVINGADLDPTPMPNQLNMQYPMNKLHLSIGEANGPSGINVRNKHLDSTFSVPIEVEHDEFQTWSINSEYMSVSSIPDDGILRMRIEWHAPDPDLDTYFSFGGVDHTLLFDVIEY